MFVIKRGMTRWVLLTAHYAVKIPSLSSYPQFLKGLLANMQERNWSGFDIRLAKVLFCSFGGWFLIMERYAPVTLEEWSEEINNGWAENFCMSDDLDMKPENFGKKYNQMFLIDYGS